MRPQPLAEGATLLDSSVYEQARQTRDARYDGRFFVGVVTTGIYCRPVCPEEVSISEKKPIPAFSFNLPKSISELIENP